MFDNKMGRVNMRLVKEQSFEYGFNHWTVEAKSLEQLEALTNELDSMGWMSKNTLCDEQTDYGFASTYAMHSQDSASFREDFRIAKQRCKTANP